jgi:hypothetical protein
MAVEKILGAGLGLGRNRLLWVHGNVEEILKASAEESGDNYKALVQRLRQAADAAPVVTAAA